MTLILALGNSQQVIQVSDRRLSVDGRLVDDESAKAAVLTCANARLAFGFAGLACVGHFSTRDWLLDALYDCGPPGYDVLGILERLRGRASRDFAVQPDLQLARPTDKRLSVMFSGYLDDHHPPLAANALLTNFQDVESGVDSAEAWTEFTLTRWSEIRPATVEPTLVQRVGNWPAMKESDEAELREMLLQRKPAHAIVGKGVRLMREMAGRPAARGTIGRQLTSIIVPRSQDDAVESGYHSAVNSHELLMADYVVLVADDMRFCLRDAKLENTARPIIVPKVGRNHPCPCGSGKKYKHCHGV